MHLKRLPNDPVSFAADVFYDLNGAYEFYADLKERIQDRIEQARGLISAAYLAKLMLYVEHRAYREHEFVV